MENTRKFGVRYLLVGGFAVNLHKFFRTTADLDICIDDADENRMRLGNALEQLEI